MIYNPTVNIKDLKNAWVILKKVSGIPFFVRNYSKVCTRDADRALLFTVQSEALDKCRILNDNRKGGYKFKVEPASKYYVNSWSINFDWNEEIVISNNLKNFSSVKANKTTINQSLNKNKEQIITKVTDKIKAKQDYLNGADARYNANLQQLKDEYLRDVDNNQKKLEKLKSVVEFIKNTDLDAEYVEKYKTNGDTTVQVLFGSMNGDTQKST